MGQKDEQPNKRKPPVKAVASTGAEKKIPCVDLERFSPTSEFNENSK